ncbi:uncharacterized protein MKZ38_004615 [Zalerion maritima]|uniref:Uncharacterized protein n=1 Tax=Zalerion maritima TaxID=339359 RepID=A0AAD5RM72_9PEZI|nr:uncharacterized protein MKZ38_004615 [Zalerion maritima]
MAAQTVSAATNDGLIWLYDLVVYLFDLLVCVLDAIMFLCSFVVGSLLTFKRRGFHRSGYPHTMSSDTMSSLYPDRPIRPLPKRRLRERLSPEEVDSIKYPPAPEANPPLFYYPASDHQDSPPCNGASDGAGDRARVFRRNGMSSTNESDDEERPRTVAIPWPSSQAIPRLSRKDNSRNTATANPPTSTGSSADGYDSLENTNKKKRKIPSPGEHVLNGGHTLAEISSLSISHSSGHDSADGALTSTSHHSGSGSTLMSSSSQGMSGPGRGRFGRTRNGRSPLRALSETTSNWVGRTGKVRPLQVALHQDTPATEGSGIISSAIANAEKLPPAQNKENTSLLQQSGKSKSSPASSLFTFTCESQVNSAVAWPGSDTASSSLQSPSSKSSTAHNMQSTQTSPPRTGSSFGHKDAGHPGNIGAEAGGPRRKPISKAERKRRLDNKLQHQADQRMTEAQMRKRDCNSQEGEWLCLFCEYELIFGEQPRALIREFELRDLQRRKDEAYKQQLIERARRRARKSKKPAGKSSGKGKNAAAEGQNQHAQSARPDHPDPHDQPDDGTDDVYGEEAEDAGVEYVEQHGTDGVFEGDFGGHGHNVDDHEHAHCLDHIRDHGGVGGGRVAGDGRVGMHPQPLQSCTCAHA